MNRNRKIKNFIIYPKFQFKLIALIMSISFIAPVMIYSFQTYSFNEQIERGQMMNLPESHPYFVFYTDFQDQSYNMFLIACGFSVLLSVILGMIASHRIAGPLVKLRTHFEKIASEPEKDHPIYFRDKDFFIELAEAYNTRFKIKK